jgi:cytochrome b561
MENKTYTTIYRIMHWAIAICMILLLLTIFLRLTWMNKNNVSDIIQDFLATTNVSLSEDETILLAKKIRKPMWDWHIYLGYSYVAAVLWLHEVFQSVYKGIVRKNEVSI